LEIAAAADVRQITIISGGQTGADRAALDFAIEHGISHGGWCPRGRIAEDGPIPLCYSLRETPSRRYAQRTEWNVRDSDGTVAFTIGATLTGGTGLTMRFAAEFGRPALHLAREAADAEGDAIKAAAAKLVRFLDEHSVAALNVAGPRASQAPTVADFVRNVLTQALRA
jgi:hypothetical protein